MDEVLFWLCSVLFFYPYALYPIALILIGLTRTAPLYKSKNYPSVSIIISAYNEAEVIDRKLDNALTLNYPADRYEIIVASDCSTDGTDAIVQMYASRGVKLIRQEKRLGKTAGLNRGVEIANNEIVVFSDADALFDADALRNMTSYFGDPQVGLVSGSTRYYAHRAGRLVYTGSLYTRLERFLKKLETRVGSCVGADGAIFGMRKSLYRELLPDEINDFVLPLTVIRQGYRVVFAEDVYCREAASEETNKEFRRQIRITNRTLHALSKYSAMFDISRYPLFSFQLISHKLLRFALPFSMIALFVLNIHLLEQGIVYAFLFAIQATFYGAAALGWILESFGRQAGMLSVLFHFLIMNAALLVGWYRFFTGRRDVTWDPRVA